MSDVDLATPETWARSLPTRLVEELGISARLAAALRVREILTMHSSFGFVRGWRF